MRSAVGLVNFASPAEMWSLVYFCFSARFTRTLHQLFQLTTAQVSSQSESACQFSPTLSRCTQNLLQHHIIAYCVLQLNLCNRKLCVFGVEITSLTDRTAFPKVSLHHLPQMVWPRPWQEGWRGTAGKADCRTLYKARVTWHTNLKLLNILHRLIVAKLLHLLPEKLH